MRIELHLTPDQTDELALRDKTVVVIDVLRSSTSIIAALTNGAKEVIPVSTVESAMKISGNLVGDVILLAGEQNGKMIDGFHLGNSPAEYTEDRVKGKSIIFRSTNGSQAMVKAQHAHELYVCGFVNISTVAETLRHDPRDFTVVCAGNNSMLSMEDSVCAGMLLERVLDGSEADIRLSDGAEVARVLFKTFGKKLARMLSSSDHGRYLTEIGFGDDLKTCGGVDTMPVLPQLEGNVLRLKRDQGVHETTKRPETT